MEILTILAFGAVGVWLLKKNSGPATPVSNIVAGDELPAPGNPAMLADVIDVNAFYRGPGIRLQPGLTGTRAELVFSGGGGPENKGATPITERGDVIRQPSWMASEDDYFGPAAPSRVPITAGGGHGQRADDHRRLGDHYGARQ